MKLVEIVRSGQPTLYINPLFIAGILQGQGSPSGSLITSNFRKPVDEIQIDDVKDVVKRINEALK
jgi:hypothetical protein